MQVSLKFAPKSIRCMWKNSEMLKRRAVAMMDVLDLHDWYAHSHMIFSSYVLQTLRLIRNLTIWLVDNDKSRTLNRRHRGKDRSTDVLSFPRHTVCLILLRSFLIWFNIFDLTFHTELVRSRTLTVSGTT